MRAGGVCVFGHTRTHTDTHGEGVQYAENQQNDSKSDAIPTNHVQEERVESTLKGANVPPRHLGSKREARKSVTGQERRLTGHTPSHTHPTDRMSHTGSLGTGLVPPDLYNLSMTGTLIQTPKTRRQGDKKTRLGTRAPLPGLVCFAFCAGRGTRSNGRCGLSCCCCCCCEGAGRIGLTSSRSG